MEGALKALPVRAGSDCTGQSLHVSCSHHHSLTEGLAAGPITVANVCESAFTRQQGSNAEAHACSLLMTCLCLPQQEVRAGPVIVAYTLA